MFTVTILILTLTILITITAVSIVIGKKYQIAAWKCIVLAFCISILSILSSRLMAIIENGEVVSLYGAVLFMPGFMIPIALLLHVKLKDMMDIAAPSGMLALSVAKVNCFFNGCCNGRYLFSFGEAQIPVYFPSQILECLSTLICFFILMNFVKKGKYRGALYPWGMIYYGVTRFGFSYMRQRREPLWGIMPPGAFWSLVTLAIAIPLIIVYKRNRRIRTDNSDSNNC